MTFITATPDRKKLKLPPIQIVGPYSPWPRKPTVSRRKKVAIVSSIGAATVFAHCVAPMLA